MKKIILGILLLAFVALGGGLAYLFSTSGNAMVASMLQQRASAALGTRVNVEHLSFGWGQYEVALQIPPGTSAQSKGTYSLFGRTLNGDYQAQVEDLGQWQQYTSRQLKGSARTSGTIAGAFTDLNIQGILQLDPGNVDYQVRLQDYGTMSADASFEDMQTTGLLAMLDIPQVLRGTINGTAQYFWPQQRAPFNIQLDRANLNAPKAAGLIRQATGIDIEREVYDEGQLKGQLDGQNIAADFFIRSKRTELRSENLQLDLQQSTINAPLQIKVGKYEVPGTLSGPIASPSVSIDMQSALEAQARERLDRARTEAEEKARQQAEEKIDEALDDRVPQELRDGLKQGLKQFLQ